MDQDRFDALARRAGTRPRRAFVTQFGRWASGLGLGVFAEGLIAPQASEAKGKRKKRKKKKKKKGAACNPPCGVGVCRDGLCDCRGQGKYTCGETCCYTQDDCINGACCLPGRACAGECCPEDEECTGGDTCCPRRRACQDVCCPEGEECAVFSHDRCCPIARICQGVCCEPGVPCVDRDCCPNAITVRDELCCPHGSGNAYSCGRFKCLGYLTGSGPGGCDWWCDLSEEGGLCGPGVDGIPTGEGNGRACCCTEPGTANCVWPT